MRKLLSVNFHTLINTKRVWLGALFMAGLAVFGDVSLYRVKAGGFEVSIDSVLIENLPVLFLFMPAMAALFINTDYHDGTIRNKLTVGVSRRTVYLSNLITTYLLTVAYTVEYIALALLIGLGLERNAPGLVAEQVLMCMVTMLALMAISVFVATMVTNRSVLVFTVMLAMGLLFGSQIINDVLLNPPMIENYSGVTFTTIEDGMQVMQFIDKNGQPIDPEDIPIVENPHYVPEPWRSVLRKVNDIQPGGQIFDILSNGHMDLDEEGNQIQAETPYWEMALYSLAVTLVFTGLGLILFQRKDLK